MTKRCAKCGEIKPREEFIKDASKRDGLYGNCKPCESARMLSRRYGLTVADYDGMLAVQGGGCGICGALTAGGQGAFHVDHDHACCPGKKSCGKCVRGLLCAGCNIKLGYIENYTADPGPWDAYVARAAGRQSTS